MAFSTARSTFAWRSPKVLEQKAAGRVQEVGGDGGDRQTAAEAVTTDAAPVTAVREANIMITGVAEAVVAAAALTEGVHTVRIVETTLTMSAMAEEEEEGDKMVVCRAVTALY